MLFIGLFNNGLSAQMQSSESEVAADNHLADMQQALDAIELLSRYQIRYHLAYTKDDHNTAQVVMIGDKETGNAKIVLNQKDDNGLGVDYRLELLAYDHFKYVYVKQQDLLTSTELTEQLGLTETQKNKLKAYQDTYIELTADQIKRLDLDQVFNELFMLMPNRAKLATIAPEDVVEFTGKYLLTENLTAIPEHLFERNALLGLDYEVRVEVMPSEKGKQIELLPKLTVKGLQNGLDMQSRVLVKERSQTFNLQQLKNMALGQGDYERNLRLQTTPILQKLKRMSITVDPAQQQYRLDLVGVMEEFKFNLWNSNPATMRSFDYSLNYEVSPTDETIPDMLSLARLSAQEYQYIVNQAIKE